MSHSQTHKELSMRRPARSQRSSNHSAAELFLGLRVVNDMLKGKLMESQQAANEGLSLSG